ncbi:MAG TPA: orc1/cdc6 family replication initiation protein [Thermoplasmata archaeon]|nr:orc1/cdc6 family replication initiation protein [Thermoplasmata archaeon]
MPPDTDDRLPETVARLETHTATNGAATPVSDRPPTGGANAEPRGTAASPAGTTTAEFLDAFLQTKSELFQENREVLRDSYVPARLPHRDGEIRQVAEVLAPALRGNTPSNLLIYGKIGTGKTAVVTQVRQDLQRRAEGAANLTFVTVNCGNIDTAYSLLQNVGNTFAKAEADRIPTGWSLDRVQAAMRRLMDAKGGTIVLVLDEIDRLVQRSGDNVLYTLSQLNTELESARLVLLGISNDLKFTNHLDARVRSRLNEEKILFDPYKAPQLQDILQDRAKVAFRDGVVDPGVIELCAAYAQLESGDARRALALLRLAAEMAERDHAKRITRDHVVKAKNRLEKDIIVECCRSLPPHCKVLLYAILQSYERRKNGVLTGEVYDNYKRLAERLGLPPLHARSISNYVSELESLGLIRATIVSRGRGGRTREIQVDVPLSETMPALEEDPLLAPLGRPKSRGQTLLTNFDNPGRTGPTY